jgi:hypothetical protein
MATRQLGGRENAKKGRPQPERIGDSAKAINAVVAVAERIGCSFAILLLLMLAVWRLGSAQTKDDFIRELLFGSVTHTRYLSLFFIILAGISISGAETFLRSYRTERAEMKRLAEEKTYWQERALGVQLSHTDEEAEA